MLIYFTTVVIKTKYDRKPMALIKKLRKKKKEAPANEKPDVVKTHLRNMVRFDDIKCYLALFSMTTSPFSIYSF